MIHAKENNKVMENLLGEREPSLIDGGKDTGTPTAAKS